MVIIMGLIIDQTNAMIGVERTPGDLEIRSRNAKLELHQKFAEVNIHTELPKVKIDQYECFATAGLKGNFDFTKYWSQIAYQQVMEYIGKTAADGYTLAAIENGGNPIKEIAVRDSSPVHEFGIDFIPKARPQIDFTGSIDIEWERTWEGTNNGVDGDFNPGSVNINFEPASISTYVKQYPSINIEYQGNMIDSKI
jgi:hypothetical protein